MRIQYELVGKRALLIASATLFFVTNVAADPKAGPTQSLLLSPHPLNVDANEFNRSGALPFDQFSLQDTSPTNGITFGSGSPLIDLQKPLTVDKLQKENGSAPSTDNWRPSQPPKLDNEVLFDSQSLHFTTQKNIQIQQPGTESGCVDVMMNASKIPGFRIPAQLKSIAGISINSESHLSACPSACLFSHSAHDAKT